jgi:hydroxymethylpyrimidine pyrophosphatase-like HAD family hydrolase
MAIRVVYTDLDGTMVGPRGCFFRDVDGVTSLEPAHALVEALDAGLVLVLVSGRTRPQLLEAAAIFGADGFVGELGGIVAWDRGRSSQVMRGEMPAEYDQVPDDLLTALIGHFPGRLSLHTPWHTGRELDVMMRGAVPVAAVDAWLVERGFGWLTMRDNGLIAPALMPDLGEPPHVYHLVPRGVSKGDAIAFDLARRGLAAAEAIAIGDSASDLSMAPRVARMHLVANAMAHHEMAELVRAHSNVIVEDGALGAGWATAVRSALPAAVAPR